MLCNLVHSTFSLSDMRNRQKLKMFHKGQNFGLFMKNIFIIIYYVNRDPIFQYLLKMLRVRQVILKRVFHNMMKLRKYSEQYINSS